MAQIKLTDCDAVFLVFGDLGFVKANCYVCTGVLLSGEFREGDVLTCVSLDEPPAGYPIADGGVVVAQQAVYGGAKIGGKGDIVPTLDKRSAGTQMNQVLVMMQYPQNRRVDRVALVRIKGSANVMQAKPALAPQPPRKKRSGLAWLFRKREK